MSKSGRNHKKFNRGGKSSQRNFGFAKVAPGPPPGQRRITQTFNRLLFGMEPLPRVRPNDTKGE
jgi:hypothetical protein